MGHLVVFVDSHSLLLGSPVGQVPYPCSEEEEGLPLTCVYSWIGLLAGLHI